jgi:hypothetical protein
LRIWKQINLRKQINIFGLSNFADFYVFLAYKILKIKIQVTSEWGSSPKLASGSLLWREKSHPPLVGPLLLQLLLCIMVQTQRGCPDGLTWAWIPVRVRAKRWSKNSLFLLEVRIILLKEASYRFDLSAQGSLFKSSRALPTFPLLTLVKGPPSRTRKPAPCPLFSTPSSCFVAS